MQVNFRIHYNTSWGESLALVMGDRKYPMAWGDGGFWCVTVPSCTDADLKDYTYVVMRDGVVIRPEWQHHSASVSSNAKMADIFDKWNECPVKGCPFPRRHSAAIFDQPGFRGAGTAVPVFSLRSESDFGIGEFRDLRHLVDWAAATGQCIIQLLPVNDTTRKGGWEDSYPYSPVTSFGLHPLYIHLQDVGVEEDSAFKAVQKELNALEEIDYPRVFEAKMKLLRKAYADFGARDMAESGYGKFCRDNAYWLDEYARFCAERDSADADFYRWTQYHLDLQLSEEVAYAASKGVYFKGDLPIGISRDSAEARFHPDLFNLDSSAGAPPDFFSKDGQNWGFPTYNWQTMAKDDYAWWKARLRKMSQYFSAFRIDHVLGFFRIWEIPVGYESGMMGHFNPALPYTEAEIASWHLPLEGLFLEDPRRPGYWHPMITPTGLEGLEQWQKDKFMAIHDDFFYHRHEDFWRREAERKLPELLGATGMLACAEDLGMVPACVPDVMSHEGLLSLEMVGMDKGRPWPYLAVCATSSHDMDTIRMQKPQTDRTPEECENILKEHLDSVCMLAIFPLQDWLSVDGGLRREDFMSERVNQPADPHHHWRFRLHIPVERIASDRKFTDHVRTLISGSGR